jgi:hypothetical protein
MSNAIKTQITTITASKAKELLGNNTRNRRISQGNLEAIKMSLTRGEWELNGEAIKVAQDGTILDGQHRLMACVETGISFKTILVTGLEHKTQTTMDTGKTRTPANVLELNGFKNAVTLAAVTSAIIRSEQYTLRAAVIEAAGSSYPLTRKQILQRAQDEPALVEVTSQARKYGPIGLPGKVAGLAIYTFSKIDPEDSEFFFRKLYTGEALDRGNPILTLRNTLQAIKNDVRGERNQVYLLALTIKAWNKFRDGESMMKLSFRPGGANPEQFPEPH